MILITIPDGRLCADPKVNTLQSGSQVANLRVASNYRTKVDGEWVSEALFFDVALWRAVETIEAYFRKGSPIVVWGDGSIVRDYVNVDDIVDAFVAASTADLDSGAYNIGSGVGHSLLEILDLVRSVTGISPVTRFEPSRSFDVPAIVLDASRFGSATGWRPQATLEDGMSRMWAYLRGMRR